MKKLLCIGLSLILAMGLISGCGSTAKSTVSEDKHSGTTLTLVTCNDYVDEVEAVAKAYQKLHPDVTIRTEPYSFDQLFETIEIKLGSEDSSFDLIYVDGPMVSGYGYRNFLEPLDSYFTEEEMAEYTEASRNASMYDGKFLAAPLNSSSGVLVYNKDLLDRAGLPYPSRNIADRMTWEELQDNLVVFQEKLDPNHKNGIWAFSFDQISRPYQILPLPNSLGGQGVKDGYLVSDVLNDEAWNKSMQFYSDLHNTLGVAPKGLAANETIELFVAGKMGYFISGTWIVDSVKANPDLNWDYAPFPYFEDGTAATPTGSWHLGVSKFSKNKEVAADFVKFMSVGEGNEILLDLYPQVAARTERLEKDLKSGDEFPVSLFALAAEEALTTAVPRPITPGYREWEQVVGNMMEDIRNGADVQESLDMAVSQLEGAMAKYAK